MDDYTGMAGGGGWGSVSDFDNNTLNAQTARAANFGSGQSGVGLSDKDHVVNMVMSGDYTNAGINSSAAAKNLSTYDKVRANISILNKSIPKAARLALSASPIPGATTMPLLVAIGVGLSGNVIGGNDIDSSQGLENMVDVDNADVLANKAQAFLKKQGTSIEEIITDSGEYKDEYFEGAMEQYQSEALDQAIEAIRSVDTDIEYNHTLAELSGIGLSDQEREYFNTQKQTAIDRALSEIENTFEPEGESIIAQQVYNLGENALGGTIGREFVNRWQERYDKAQTSAISDIESSYLAAEQSAINRNQMNQLDLWGKEYEADVKRSEMELDKATKSAMLQYEWDKSNLDRFVTMRGQDISEAQAELDRALKEKMGDTEYQAWQDTNKWQAIGSSVGSILGSDWFGDTIKSWWS